MAATAMRILSVARASAGVTTVVFPRQFCALIGVPSHGSSFLLSQLVGARELAFGAILWPRLARKPSTASGSGLATDSYAERSHNEQRDSASGAEPELAYVPPLQTSVQAVILADVVDMGLCVVGWTAGELSLETLLSLGAMGVAGVGCSALCLRALNLKVGTGGG